MVVVVKGGGIENIQMRDAHYELHVTSLIQADKIVK